jgi:uncharacterized cofD-like protein
VSSAKKNIVVIGGGNGSSVLISSLKDDFDVTAIVSMADDGGSTGRLRKELGTSAVGDIRQCLVAFASSADSKNLFSYRFSSGGLQGHSFGNIFLTTVEQATGSLYKAIDQAKNVLNINNGEIIPVTDRKPHLEMTHGKEEFAGVYKIANTKIKGMDAKFRLRPSDSELSQEANEHIEKADLIIIAPGNFYCSIIPALMVKGMREALERSKAKKVFISNLVNFSNHTEGFDTSDYLSEINRISRIQSLDVLISNSNYDIGTDDQAIKIAKEGHRNIQIIQDDLVSSERSKADPNDKISQLRSKVSHNKNSLNKIITHILRS